MDINKETETKNTLIGVDLGQARDFSAISIIKQQQDYGMDMFEGKNKIGKRYYHVIHLERPPLETSYENIVDRVIQLYRQTEKGKIVIDFTGVGRPVFDMFRREGVVPYGISITGGSQVTRDGYIYNVPKRDLAGCLQVLYQQQRIKVSGKLDHARTLNNELLDFKVKIDAETGHDTYEHRSGKHDDLVLSVACACWYGEDGIKEMEVTPGAKALRKIL